MTSNMDVSALLRRTKEGVVGSASVPLTRACYDLTNSRCAGTVGTLVGLAVLCVPLVGCERINFRLPQSAGIKPILRLKSRRQANAWAAARRRKTARNRRRTRGHCLVAQETIHGCRSREWGTATQGNMRGHRLSSRHLLVAPRRACCANQPGADGQLGHVQLHVKFPAQQSLNHQTLMLTQTWRC